MTPRRRRISQWILALLLPLALGLGIRAYRQWSDFQKAQELFAYGDALMDRGDMEGAEVPFQESIALCPDMVASYDSLALCYEATKQPKKAVALLQGVTQRIVSPVLFRQLATAQEMCGQNQEAAKSYATAFRLEPDNLVLDKLRVRAEKRASERPQKN